jgi:hypothetical protein
MPRPCRAALIHTCHDASLPFSDSAVSFVKVCVVTGNIRTASPATTVCSNMLRGTPRGSRKKPKAGRSPTCRLWTADANSHVLPMPRCAVALRSRFQNGMVVAWHGRGMTCVNKKWPHCVNQMGKTQSKPLGERHGRGMGTAWYV